MSHITEFAEILNQQMQNVCKAGEQTVLEFGTILGDLSLAVDGLKDRIPKGEYLVSSAISGFHTGDRVLTAWSGGQPIVMIILKGSERVTLSG